MEGIKRAVFSVCPAAMREWLRGKNYLRMLKRLRVEDERDLIVVKALLRSGQTAVDVGANFGLYSMFLARFVGDDGLVLSVEPVPNTFHYLTTNLSRLGLTNVTYFNCAVSDSAGSVAMTIPQRTPAQQNFYRARIVDDSESSFVVKSVPLDDIVAEVDHIHFVKIDVEGHELQCLRGATTLLESSETAWLVEIDCSLDDPSTKGFQVMQLFSKAGYATYWFDGNHLREWQPGEKSTNYFFLQEPHIEQIVNVAPSLVT